MSALAITENKPDIVFLEPTSLTTAQQPPTLENIRIYAKQRVAEEWGEEQWIYFDELIRRESNWNYLAANPYSTARGLCQTMTSVHKNQISANFTTDPEEQLRWCVNYVSQRYGTPEKAITFWNLHKYF